jgi:hypothetical protein
MIALPFALEIATTIALPFTLEVATSSPFVLKITSSLPFEILANVFSSPTFTQPRLNVEAKIDSKAPSSRQEQIIIQLQWEFRIPFILP